MAYSKLPGLPPPEQLANNLTILTDQLTDTLTKSLAGTDLRDALGEVTNVREGMQSDMPDAKAISQQSRSIASRLLAALDIGDKLSGSIQTAIYATEALVVLAGWANTAYQIIQNLVA